MAATVARFDSARIYYWPRSSVQQLGLRIGFDEGGMPVRIGQELHASTMCQQPLVERGSELDDRALIAVGIGMWVKA